MSNKKNNIAKALAAAAILSAFTCSAKDRSWSPDIPTPMTPTQPFKHVTPSPSGSHQ